MIKFNMSEIIEAAQLPNDEKVYLKKGIFGWDVVHPMEDENGIINWPNTLFGGYGNLFKLLFILLVVFLFILGTREVVMGYKMMYDNCMKKVIIVNESLLDSFSLAGDYDVRETQAGS